MSAVESSFSSPFSQIKEATHSPLTQKEVSEILQIYSPLGNEVDAILKSLLTDSQNTSDLGDHLTAGRGYIGLILQAALQQKTIQYVILGLEKIRDVVKARADGNVKRLFFPSEFATRATFVGRIDQKIQALEQLAKRLEKEESHPTDEKDKKEESDAEEKLRVMQDEKRAMEEKVKELERRQLEEKKLKEEEIEVKRREVESAQLEMSNLKGEIESLSSEKEKVTEKLKQEEARNKELESAAANWVQLSTLALSFIPSAESGAIMPRQDVNAAVFQLVARMLQEKAEEQKQREQAIEEAAQKQKQKQKQGEDELQPKPYAHYETESGKSVYKLNDMQAMILYRKPLLVFKVIKSLLNELPRLNAEIKSLEAKLKEFSVSSGSSSSNAFAMFPNQGPNPQVKIQDIQAKIHNIQVILCYFFLYNAPMCFLIEQAKVFAQKNQHLPKNSWNILQMMDGEIPGLKEIEVIIQSERQEQQDDYESYNKFVQSGITELSKQKDRNGKLLSKGYCEPHHTFTYHQRLGMVKLFRSQNIAKLFGDSELANNFCKTLLVYGENYEAAYKKDPNQPTMDVEMREGQLDWINSAILLTQPQTSARPKK